MVHILKERPRLTATSQLTMFKAYKPQKSICFLISSYSLSRRTIQPTIRKSLITGHSLFYYHAGFVPVMHALLFKIRPRFMFSKDEDELQKEHFFIRPQCYEATMNVNHFAWK